MSLFITFEGGEGCGKSTQARALCRKLSRSSISAELTREPGGTALGEQIRHLLKKRREDRISPEAELLLFAAARAELVSQVIRPALQQGKVVLCDRFADSTSAYQGYGRGLDLAVIHSINTLATGGTMPDLTVLLDIPPATGLGRRQAELRDRFENEDVAFHNRIRAGYLKLADQEPNRWLVIDATLPRRAVGKAIWDRVKPLLPERTAAKHG